MLVKIIAKKTPFYGIFFHTNFQIETKTQINVLNDENLLNK